MYTEDEDMYRYIVKRYGRIEIVGCFESDIINWKI